MLRIFEGAEDDREARRSMWKQDQDFCTAMMRAIRADREHPPIGIDARPGTTNPVIFARKG